MASIFRLLAAVTLLGMQISLPVLRTDALRIYRLRGISRAFNGTIVSRSYRALRNGRFPFKTAVKNNLLKIRVRLILQPPLRMYTPLGFLGSAFAMHLTVLRDKSYPARSRVSFWGYQFSIQRARIIRPIFFFLPRLNVNAALALQSVCT